MPIFHRTRPKSSRDKAMPIRGGRLEYAPVIDCDIAKARSSHSLESAQIFASPVRSPYFLADIPKRDMLAAAYVARQTNRFHSVWIGSPRAHRGGGGIGPMGSSGS